MQPDATILIFSYIVSVVLCGEKHVQNINGSNFCQSQWFLITNKLVNCWSNVMMALPQIVMSQNNIQIEICIDQIEQIIG